MRGLAIAVAMPLLGLLVLAARNAAPEATAQGTEAPSVHVVTSGSHSERVRTVPIAKRPRRGGRVVMSLGPGRLGALSSGDRIEGRTEVEVSTTCLERMPKCVGRRYTFSPRVAARLVLARGSKRARGRLTRPLSGWRRLVCSQKLPSRNHHCVLVIPSAGRQIADASRLPCRRCHVNLIVSAHHPHAKRGNKLVVGVDHPRGVTQNKGQLATVVYRPGEAKLGGSWRQTRRRGIKRLPIGPNRRAGARRRVIYSVRLNGLRAGESLVVDSRMVGKIKHLRYNALVQAKLILSDRPDSPKGGWRAARIGSFDGRVGVQNGFNCTQGRSGHRDPCVVDKTGVMRIIRDARQRPILGEGERIPMYLNLVVGTRAVGVHSPRRRASHRMRILQRHGFLRVQRYGREHQR